LQAAKKATSAGDGAQNQCKVCQAHATSACARCKKAFCKCNQRDMFSIFFGVDRSLVSVIFVFGVFFFVAYAFSLFLFYN
jgi:hypothetical protein